MGLGLKYILSLVFIIALYVTGMLIFAKGFLLKRVVIEKNSSCAVDFAHQNDLHGGEGCWMHGNFKKAIIIIIDALKFDFIHNDPSVDSDIPYKNKMRTMYNLKNKKPFNTKIYKFIADPPTTTLQRLKGLTTGSLPTFVDMGTNFASSEINEDNFLDQLCKQGKVLKFMGDDTWVGLYPGRFYKSYPFPSFNVKDLHTVDNGILMNLLPQLRKKDWDVTIAHFLGVDHCGHRYGPNHPAMAEKLSQMDQMIKNVTKEMKEDTILFVLGDHGMTRTGDHGGDSQDELEAGLFVYSPLQISSVPSSADIESVSQKDFVPTISLLLGVPIPFSSLGKVITDLFTFCPWWKTGNSQIKQVFHAVEALRLNAHQINKYLQEYFHHSSDFPINTYYQLNSVLTRTEAELQALLTSMVKEGETRHMVQQLTDLKTHYVHFIDQVIKTSEGIWAKFDTMSMFIGIMTMALALVVNIYFIKISVWWKCDIPTTVIIVVLVSIVYLAFALFQSFLIGESYSVFMVFLLGSCLMIAVLLLIYNFKHKDPLILNPDEKNCTFKYVEHSFFGLITTLYFGSFFSNSFIVYEDSMTVFFFQSLSWMYCVSNLKNILSQFDTSSDSKLKKQKPSKTFDIMRVLTHPAVLLIFMTVLWNLSVRLSVLFRACREEQHLCENSIFLQPLGSFTNQGNNKNFRYFFSVACLIILVMSLRQLMKYFGNLNGTSLTEMGVSYLIPMSALCCVLHWALQGLPQKMLDSLPAWQQVFLPRIVYFLIVVMLICMYINPLCIFPIVRSNRLVVDNDSNLIPNIYNKLKNDLKEKEDNRPPLVYGLATSFTAAVITMATVVIVLLSLLLGDGLMPSLILIIISSFFLLEAITYQESLGTQFSIFTHIISLSVQSSLFFFATGHQATVPTIRWESAFVGLHGDFTNNIVPGILVHINTFASYIFHGVIFPLILFLPAAGGIFTKWIVGFNRREESQWKGDYLFHETKDKLRVMMFRILTCHILFSGLKVFGTMIAASVHKRHLMVWKIFAPRFVFEAMSSFTTFGMTLFVFTFILHVDKALLKWTESFKMKQSQN